MKKIKILSKFGYQTFPIVDNMIEVSDEDLLCIRKRTKCFDINHNCIIPYDNSKDLEKQKLEQEKLERTTEIKARLNELDQDIIQHEAGEIVPNYPERLAEFRTLHNELRALEGKEPRQEQI